MDIIRTAIPDVMVLVPRRHGDHRGFFSETYNRRALQDHGIDLHFVQDNHSLSAEKGVLRGLHFQEPPSAQDKLVRVVRGAILDVAVDIRRDSPTFGQHVAEELSADNWRQMFVPVGFAHGFVTLEPETEVIYKVSSYYAPQHDRGLLWSDPALAIDWPVTGDEVILSEKDRQQPLLSELSPIAEWSPGDLDVDRSST